MSDFEEDSEIIETYTMTSKRAIIVGVHRYSLSHCSDTLGRIGWRCATWQCARASKKRCRALIYTDLELTTVLFTKGFHQNVAQDWTEKRDAHEQVILSRNQNRSPLQAATVDWSSAVQAVQAVAPVFKPRFGLKPQVTCILLVYLLIDIFQHLASADTASTVSTPSASNSQAAVAPAHASTSSDQSSSSSATPVASEEIINGFR